MSVSDTGTVVGETDAYCFLGDVAYVGVLAEDAGKYYITCDIPHPTEAGKQQIYASLNSFPDQKSASSITIHFVNYQVP